MSVDTHNGSQNRSWNPGLEFGCKLLLKINQEIKMSWKKPKSKDNHSEWFDGLGN